MCIYVIMKLLTNWSRAYYTVMVTINVLSQWAMPWCLSRRYLESILSADWFQNIVIIIVVYYATKAANIHTVTCTRTQHNNKRFMALLCLATWVSRYQKKYSPTHHPDHHPVFISLNFHMPWSIASSLFKLRAWQSFCTTSFHVLFGLPLGL